MRVRRFTIILLLSVAFPSAVVRSQESQPSARQLLLQALTRWADIAEPTEGQPARTLVAQLKLTRGVGLPQAIEGLEVSLAFQAPDRLRIGAANSALLISVARFGDQIWVYEPAKNFAVIGKPGVPFFKAEPDRLDQTHIGPFKLPISRLKLSMVPYMLDVEQEPIATVAGERCHVLRIGMLPAAVELFGVWNGHAKLWLRESDLLPVRIAVSDGDALNVEIDVSDVHFDEPWADEKWQLHPNATEHVETTAVSHLLRFLNVGPKILKDKVAPLGPAEGERELVDTCGGGRLEMIDGTRVLFLKGSPAEMGRQQGTLIKKQARQLCEHVLYGFGIASSFEKGKWFFSEVEQAESRLEPFMDKRYLEEMDALADAAHMDRQEARLANFFPELFHCSGFSMFGRATKDGHMYHGRILDYLRGIGLEENAVVTVYQPDYGNAWVNLGYAGFVGSVTAMNEKGISIGEMGGEGYGQWDGKPMAQLVREVMEKADTLDDAVRIMRFSPRTCHYYYVISDGKTKQAVGIEATPGKFLVVHPGQAVPELPHALEDAVLLSAGDRYETLWQRARSGYGTFDDSSARDLMTRPVCMTSNIQSVLFEPDTLDFWVANADSSHVASAARYTHYNLRKLLDSRVPRTALQKMRDRLGF